MKASSAVDHVTGVAIVTITLEKIEDPGEAQEVIKSVGRLLWPNIVFPGEPGYDEAPFIGEWPDGAVFLGVKLGLPASFDAYSIDDWRKLSAALGKRLRARLAKEASHEAHA